jgi:hypothetical protein
MRFGSSSLRPRDGSVSALMAWVVRADQLRYMCLLSGLLCLLSGLLLCSELFFCYVDDNDDN